MTKIIFWFSVLMTVYVYAGYPVLVALLARLRKKVVYRQEYFPNVTILIAAYDEETSIAGKIENTLDLDYPANLIQILVAADGSQDRTVEIVSGYQDRGIEVSYQPLREGKMAAIKRAQPFVRGEIIVFSDANNLFEPGTLKALLKPFADRSVGGVSGAKHIFPKPGSQADSEGIYWKYESFIKTQETRLSSCTGVSGELFAIRRELFPNVPGGMINDDFYIAMSILKRGSRVVYVPEARSFEHGSLRLRDERIRRARINAGRYQTILFAKQLLPVRSLLLMWQVISHKYLRLLIPFFMAFALIANIGIVMQGLFLQQASIQEVSLPLYATLLSLQGLFYLAAWLTASRRIPGFLGKVLAIPAFLVSSNMAAIEGLIYTLRHKDGALWQKVRRAEDGGVVHG